MIEPYKLPIYVDSSMLTTWRSCRRKFKWTYLDNLVPKGESVHLIAGGAFAAAMDAIRKHIHQGDKQYDIDELLNVAMPAFLKAWGDYKAPENTAKSLGNTFYALEQYLVNHHPQTDEVEPLLPDTCSAEFSFAVPLPVLHPSGEPFIFAGRYDLLGTFNGMPVGLDEKTTGSFAYNWDSQWNLRGQFLGYTWASRQLGYDLKHFIIRGIAIQKTQVQFRTAITTYPEHLIGQWYTELLATLTEICHAIETNTFPFNFGDSCASYGGCPYQILCSSKSPEAFFVEYKERTWSPVNGEANDGD